MLAVLLSLVAAATPAPRLALPGLDRVDVDAQKADFFLEYLAQELSESGYQVVTRKQIDAVLGMERQKELLGCADANSSCLAELAGALGAEIILVGTVARLGDEYVFTLKLVSAKDARTLAQRRGGGGNDREALEWLATAGRALAAAALPRRTGLTPRFFSFIPVVVSLGLGAGSIALYSSSRSVVQQLEQGVPRSQGEATALATSGAQQQAGAALLFGGAVLMLAVAALLVILGDRP